MRFSFSLWIKSWQQLRVYFKQSQWFLERWKTHEGHNGKQAENLTVGQGETRVIKSTASFSSTETGQSPQRCTPPICSFSLSCLLKSCSKLKPLPADLLCPCCWPVLHGTSPVCPGAEGCRGLQLWQKKRAGATNSNTKVRSITKKWYVKGKNKLSVENAIMVKAIHLTMARKMLFITVSTYRDEPLIYVCCNL